MSVSGSGSPAYLSVIACAAHHEAWPIEVGWGFADGEVRSMMIAPACDWSLSAWDKGAEGRHRLALHSLLSEGKKPLDACLVLNAALGQSTVFAAMPELESLFLFKLYKAAGVNPNYRLHGAEPRPELKPQRAAEGVEHLRKLAGAAEPG